MESRVESLSNDDGSVSANITVQWHLLPVQMVKLDGHCLVALLYAQM